MDDFKKENIRLRIFDQAKEHSHFHQEYELIYVLYGGVEISIASEDFGKEAEVIYLETEGMYLINANKRHSLILDKDGLICKVFISYELVTEMLDTQHVYFICDSSANEGDKYDELKSKIKKLLTHFVYTDGKVSDFGHISLCYDLLDTLCINFLLTGQDKWGDNLDNSFETRINQINNYIRANYKSEMSLSNLASQLYLSEAYLSRFFKKNFGMSFVKYVNNIRLTHAMEQIVNTDDPITKIAYENGFSNATVFNKNFKQIYGETPSQYRKENRNKTEERVVPSTNRLKDKLEAYFINQIDDESAVRGMLDTLDVKCNVNSKKYLPTGKPFADICINAGSAEEMLNSALREHIKLLKETVDFKYVRFWDIFNNSIVFSIENEEGIFNFSRLDSIIDFILEIGMKPVLEFGAKPKKVQKNVRTPIKIGDDSGLKYDPDKWGSVVEAFFNHLIHYYGEEELNTWVIELWNDERGGQITNYDYKKLFNQTAEIVRSVGLETKIGGCGIRGDLPSDKITEFLQDWYNMPFKPDYISFIHFPYESGEIKSDMYSRRNTDREAFFHMVNKIRTCMNEAGLPETMPLTVSEWNSSLSDRNVINDSCYRAAYIVKNYLQIMNDVHSVCFFQATDRMVEYYDTKGIIFGGTGLVTRNSILKPAAFAFEFISRLKPIIIVKDENYIVTKDSKNSLLIVCHNMKELNYSYYLLPEGDAKKEDVWKYFEDLDNLNINFEIGGYKPGEYKAKITRVNDDSGSILNIWKELGFESELTKKDIKFCSKICEPGLSISRIQCEDGRINIPVTLKPNEICCIHMRNDL